METKDTLDIYLSDYVKQLEGYTHDLYTQLQDYTQNNHTIYTSSGTTLLDDANITNGTILTNDDEDDSIFVDNSTAVATRISLDQWVVGEMFKQVHELSDKQRKYLERALEFFSENYLDSYDLEYSMVKVILHNGFYLEQDKEFLNSLKDYQCGKQ